MKIWSDLLSTDYGLMSLIVISVVLVGMTIATVYVLRRIHK